MRPERLRLCAFGAYAGEQEIDFGSLGSHRLFLIHGPTGSGKTTLLDAMCFALFGESSGKERAAGDLRSHHAAADRATEVELDFSIGAQAYRVRRTPAQSLPGRGGRMVTRQPEVTLWRRSPAGDLSVLAEKVTPVRDALDGLLGYSADEFRQVVLLPQGRFRELLVAPPGIRKDILATLFRSALYRRIEEALARMTKEAEHAANRAETERATLLSEAGAPGIAEAAERAAALEEAACEAAATVAAASVRAATAERHLADAREVARLLTEAEAARRELSVLEAGIAENEARRGELDAARRAASLAADEARLAAATAEATRDAEAARRKAETAEAEERRLEAARAALADAPARAARERAARTEASRLEALATQAGAIGEAEHALAVAAAQVDAARTVHASAEGALATAAERARTAEAAKAAAQDLSARVEDRRAVVTLAEARARDAAELARAEREAERLETAHAGAASEHALASGMLEAARAALAEAERAARLHGAATLAATLAPGSPCPVCGSLDHPAHARPGEGEAADIALPRARFEEAVARERRAHEALTRLAAESSAAASAREGAALRLAASEGSGPVPIEAARAALAEAERAAQSLPKLRAAAVSAEASRTEAQTAATEATEVLRAAGERRAAGEARLATLLTSLPPEARDAAALTRRIMALTREAETLRAGLERDGKALAAAEASLTSARAARAEAEAVSRSTADTVVRTEALFLAACHAAGFEDAAAWRTARRDAGEAAALAEEIAAFGERLAAVRETASRTAAAAACRAMPDLTVIEAEAAARREQEGQARQAEGMARQQAGAAAALLGRLREADRAFAEARAHHARVAGLSGITKGDNRRRLSLEAFVLASLLDESLAAANVHLATMLSGRFRLSRREEPGRANAAVGLDIEVLDEWTGQARPAGTLSGGEGFCAALALALGLSETVQAHAGARRIDALLIDEGFGSLDEDALDTAMEVLSTLPGSDRIVGIISHVGELKQRIAARLEVTPGLRGSTARFVLG